MLATGCAGFIGANFLKKICVGSKDRFVILDALTYAGFYPSIEKDIQDNDNLEFVKADLRDQTKINEIFSRYDFDGVINFAAESHVDRSIENPNIFVETNVIGTLNLLNESLKVFRTKPNFRFLQVSTDEVYGTLDENDPAFVEETPLTPNSPYSASKTSADLMVRSFNETYGLPTVVTRCSNNYGPYQFPEKLIPLMIHNATRDIKLPVYGDGRNIRDWIFVEDHVDGVWAAFEKGKAGEVYNFGGASEKRNIEIVKLLLSKLGKSEELIEYVPDRLGHDWRYAVDFSKAERELDWRPNVTFEKGIDRTVSWYKENQDWVKQVLAK